MRDLCQEVLDEALRQGASYADVRLEELHEESLSCRNDVIVSIRDDWSAGAGVRVLVDGSWGFSSVDSHAREPLLEAARRAVAIAAASALVRGEPIVLAPVNAISASWQTPVDTDPFGVSAQDKVDLLIETTSRAAVGSSVRVRQANTAAGVRYVIFASSEGSYIEQRQAFCGGGLRITAVGDEDAQVRSYPNSFGGQWSGGGWEVVEAMQLPSFAGPTAREAVALLTADECPSGVYDLILDSTQLALQIHESCGHPSEADRLFDYEASYAGGSFLEPHDLGELRYGSDVVSLVADATAPGGLGTFAFDDEGVPASRWDLVRNGIVEGMLTSREIATKLGMPSSNGAMRAQNWSRIPLIRMVNISLEPVSGSLNELIEDTERGILMETNRSWSIDDRRYNFQFGCEQAWEIQNGRRVRLLKNPTYAGITPDFWGSCDAVCGQEEFELWGVRNCGKGQPGQTIATSHGAAPARFRSVDVGVGYTE